MGTGMKASFLTGLTATSLTDLEGVGQHRFEGGKVYKWVLYDEGDSIDIVAGDVLVYKAIVAAAHVVTADFSEGDTLPIAAGIAMGTVTVDLTYMWIQIKGFATLSLDVTGSTPGDGDALCAATNGGTNKTAIIDPPDNRNRLGVSVDDSAKGVLLDCPW